MSYTKASIEKALELAISETTDSECPKEWHDEFTWPQCSTCRQDFHENRARDLKCWKRYYLEKAALQEAPS